MKKMITQGENIAHSLATMVHEKCLKSVGRADLKLASGDVCVGDRTLVKLEEPPVIIPRPRIFMDHVAKKVKDDRDVAVEVLLKELLKVRPDLASVIDSFQCKHVNNYSTKDMTNYRPNVEPHLRAGLEKDRTEAWVENNFLQENIWWVSMDQTNKNIIILIHRGQKPATNTVDFDPFL
jgi:hypothetical protein